MKRPVITWALAGALLASVAFNWRQLEARELTAAQPGAEAPAAPEASCAQMGLAGLGLEPDQNAVLQEVCESSCASSESLAQQADELEAQLFASLARDDVDAARARRLAEEVAELRRRSLAACVEGILRVREVLTPAQRDELVLSCAPAPPPR